MQARYKILQQLVDGHFHSGEKLGAELGISRAAVWKHLQSLRDMGIEVFSVRGRGYRLAQALELLDAETIRTAMGAEHAADLQKLEVFQTLDSTNQFLLRELAQGAQSGTVCCAETQTDGRGRRGKKWISPYGSNLYLSLLWRFARGPADLSGLSLVIGVLLLRALQEAGVSKAGLKWPNDILHNGRKLAGILIDLSGESQGPCTAIIGIGVNIRMPEAHGHFIDQPWTDLVHASGRQDLSRNELAGRLLYHLFAGLRAYEQSALAPFVQEWAAADVTAGRDVELTLPNETVRGRAAGIAADGTFLLETNVGIRRFASGEISLRIQL